MLCRSGYEEAIFRSHRSTKRTFSTTGTGARPSLSPLPLPDLTMIADPPSHRPRGRPSLPPCSGWSPCSPPPPLRPSPNRAHPSRRRSRDATCGSASRRGPTRTRSRPGPRPSSARRATASPTPISAPARGQQGGGLRRSGKDPPHRAYGRAFPDGGHPPRRSLAAAHAVPVPGRRLEARPRLRRRAGRGCVPERPVEGRHRRDGGRHPPPRRCRRRRAGCRSRSTRSRSGSSPARPGRRSGTVDRSAGSGSSRKARLAGPSCEQPPSPGQDEGSSAR